MSLRRLRILIEHLPPESATRTAMRNAADPEALAEASREARPDRAAWSNTELLLAALMDTVRAQTSVAIAAAGGTPPPFEPTPRPGVPPKASVTPRKLTQEQRRALDPRLQQPKE